MIKLHTFLIKKRGRMNQEIFDWILLLFRWLHITVAVTWIGTSIFFMWLDRTFVHNPESKRPGHIGDLWMVHGGGFYHVEKLQMGPTKVPEHLHWFKWESYWTWMSGFVLLILTYYLGDGTFLLDDMVSDISYWPAVGLCLVSIFGSWFFYDFLWEMNLTKHKPMIGHVLTFAWLGGMSYLLCKTISGRAAYIHIGGMMGTWMTANVFMRIIPRQVKMVEASRKGEAVNQDWGKNAKNRSTHNTYLTLPVIFVMLSNHFPQTYGHELNWLILLILTIGGAGIREYFVSRLNNPSRSKMAGVMGVAMIILAIVLSREPVASADVAESKPALEKTIIVDRGEIQPMIKPLEKIAPADNGKTFDVKGVIAFDGQAPANKKLNLPSGCTKPGQGDVFSNEILVKDGKLKNVLIRVVKGHAEGSYHDVPKEEVVLDQKGCIYTPRVTAARVGQSVTFVNSDPIFHNVRSVTDKNQRFNVAMPKKDQRITKVFDKPELFLQAKCSVHPWMGAYVAIMDHPFFDVSDEKGEFTLPKLPSGKYTIEAWHEIFGTQTQEIEVSETQIPTLKFTFKPQG